MTYPSQDEVDAHDRRQKLFLQEMLLRLRFAFTLPYGDDDVWLEKIRSLKEERIALRDD